MVRSASQTQTVKAKRSASIIRFFWRKQFPNGMVWDLTPKKNSRGYYFEWNASTKKHFYSSDSLLNTFRWYQMKDVLKDVRNHVEKGLHLDYSKWLEDYVRKLYTMDGMIIFPCRCGGINTMRAFTKVKDRVDLTFECIRRHYSGEKSPLSNCLEKDKAFFDLFKDFRGYVDFFLLQDIVSDDYKHVKCLFENREYCDEFFVGSKETTVPQTADEYWQWYENTLDFVEKRNVRIESWGAV